MGQSLNDGNEEVNQSPSKPWGLVQWFMFDLAVGLVIVWLVAVGGRPATQSVFIYGMEGHNLLSETTRNLSTSTLSTTEHIYLPTASGPMPVAVVIGGVHSPCTRTTSTPRAA